MGRRRKKRTKRGFAVCILVVFDEQTLHLWKVFSETVRKYKSIQLPRKWKNASEKDKYHFFEMLLDQLRPLMEKGIKSILLVESQGTSRTTEFLTHIQKHHRWLTDSRGTTQASFGQITGTASELGGVNYLLEQETTREKIKRITSQEAYSLIKHLEKALHSKNPNIKVVYGVQEIEDLIYEGGKKDESVAKKVDYLLLTENFLETYDRKNRIYRLKQIAENKGIKTKILLEDTPAAERIDQFGGIICFKTAYY